MWVWHFGSRIKWCCDVWLHQLGVGRANWGFWSEVIWSEWGYAPSKCSRTLWFWADIGFAKIVQILVESEDMSAPEACWQFIQDAFILWVSNPAEYTFTTVLLHEWTSVGVVAGHLPFASGIHFQPPAKVSCAGFANHVFIFNSSSSISVVTSALGLKWISSHCSVHKVTQNLYGFFLFSWEENFLLYITRLTWFDSIYF